MEYLLKDKKGVRDIDAIILELKQIRRKLDVYKRQIFTLSLLPIWTATEQEVFGSVRTFSVPDGAAWEVDGRMTAT